MNLYEINFKDRLGLPDAVSLPVYGTVRLQTRWDACGYLFEPNGLRVGAADPIAAIKLAVKLENKRITALRSDIINDKNLSPNDVELKLAQPVLKNVTAEDVKVVSFVQAVEVSE